MAVMMGSLYDALIKAGSDSDSAQKAAEEVANFEGRVNGLENRFDRLEARMDARFGIMEAKINTLTWMVGIVMTMLFLVLGGLLGLLWKLFPVGGLG